MFRLQSTRLKRIFTLTEGTKSSVRLWDCGERSRSLRLLQINEGPQKINRHLFSPPQAFRVNKLSVAVIGAGIGGLATAAAPRRVGIEVTVYEQACRFARIGAGIQIGCNAMKVLRAFGLEPNLRAAAFYPRSWNNRDFDTGRLI